MTASKKKFRADKLIPITLPEEKSAAPSALGTDRERSQRIRLQSPKRSQSPVCNAETVVMRRKILVIDIGGSNVKLMVSRREKRKFKSGRS
jgi:hypothetical protein